MLRATVRRGLCFYLGGKKREGMINSDWGVGLELGMGRSILRNAALKKASGKDVEGRCSGDKMGHSRTSKLLAVAREKGAGTRGTFDEQLERNLGSVAEAFQQA